MILKVAEEQPTHDRTLKFIPYNVFLDLTGERPTSVLAILIFSKK